MAEAEAPTRAARRTRSDGERTRAAILRQAVSLATVDGLEGLSIGNLADALGLSKSGLYAHFGSKEELQLATVEEAARIFQTEVLQPALTAEKGVARLFAVTDAYLDHLRRRTYPGGCFFSAVSLEMGTRPGRVRDRIAMFQSGFRDLVKHFAEQAIERGELPADEDPEQLAFEINGIILAADTSFVLHDDPHVLEVAAAVVRRRLQRRAP